MKNNLSLWLSFALLLAGCGGESGNVQPPVAVVPTAPVITFSFNSNVLDESSTATFTVSAIDYLSKTVTTQLSCDAGTLKDNVFTPPNVVVPTNVLCTATATDSGNRSSTKSISLTINPVTPTLAFANGATSATSAALTAINIAYASIAEGLIDAKLNNVAIKLGVTSDNKLVFFPPLGLSGTQTLTLELEGKDVSFQFTQQPSTNSINDTKAYLNDYLVDMQQQVEDQIIRAKTKGLANSEIQKLNAIKQSFDPAVISQLKAEEIELLAYLVNQNFSNFYDDNLAFNLGGDISILASNAITPSLSACEKAAVKVVAAGAVTYATTLAAAGLASTGVGVPAAIVTVIGAAVSWNFLNYTLDRMDELCFKWASTMLETGNQFSSIYQLGFTHNNSNVVLATPITSEKNANNPVDFFHQEAKSFNAIRKYQLLEGAEGYLENIINTVNKIRGSVAKLVNVIGTNNTPAFILEFIAETIDLNDYLYEPVDAQSLTISNISTPTVTGDLIAKGERFDLIFAIKDLNTNVIPFEFSLVDAKVENGVTVIPAKVTLNPPVAYDLTFPVTIGSDLNAQLEADYETGFIVKSQPSKGILEFLPVNKATGIFKYTPDKNLTEATTDSFTFSATNGSTVNGGESNVATVTIQIAPVRNCPDFVTEVVEVTNPITGRTWMDRNLGASRVATSLTDELAYGNYYQWGRGPDGHHCLNSTITTVLSVNVQPGHGDFIISPDAEFGFNWITPPNESMWQGVNGINNPCPAGFRLPTESEFEQELASWSSPTHAGAFASTLKLPLPGQRIFNDGAYSFVSMAGAYWTSTTTVNNNVGAAGRVSKRLLMTTIGSVSLADANRANGNTVRCIKN